MRAGDPDLQVQAEITASDEYFRLQPDPTGGSGGLIFSGSGSMSFGSIFSGFGSIGSDTIFSSFGSINSFTMVGTGVLTISNSASLVLTEPVATFASKYTVPVAYLGQMLSAPVGYTPKLRFTLDARFDTTDTSSAVEDSLLVYLVDSANPTQTLLDRGTPGTALMALTAAGAELAPNLVRYENGVVEIDVSSLGNGTGMALVFQLLNFDSDTGTQVTIGPVFSVSSPAWEVGSSPPAPTPPVLPGEALDLSGLVAASDFSLHVQNVRYAESTGTLTAEFLIENRGTTAAREAVVVFPFAATVPAASGVDVDGFPYVSFHNAIPPAGLEPGMTSLPVELSFSNLNDAPFPLHARVLVQPV